jgi:hypothetical protein
MVIVAMPLPGCVLHWRLQILRATCKTPATRRFHDSEHLNLQPMQASSARSFGEDWGSVYAHTVPAASNCCRGKNTWSGQKAEA